MILVIGDIMLDEYIVGPANRLSPEAPVPVVSVKEHFCTLGGAANVANNLKSLGEDVLLIGAIGEDNNGKILIENLDKENIKHALIITNNIPTTCKTRIISANQQIVRFDIEKKYNQEKESIGAFDTIFDSTNIDLIVISDYNKGFCSSIFCKRIIAKANIKNIKVIIDPKGTNWDKYEGAYLVKPNLKELSEIANVTINNEDDIVTKEAKLIKNKFELQNILVTRGDKGMTLIGENNYHVHGQELKVFDVSGAGDTVLAVLAYGLMKNYSLMDTMKMANKAAEIVVQEKYVHVIKLKELSK
jgi:rfaE bifunctional protein kinase chain/domain